MTMTDRYFDSLIERLEAVRQTQRDALDQAAEICAAAIAADGLVFTFGTGHGAFPALESFPRSGTIVGFRPIPESTMISFHRVWGDMGARQYRFIHAQEGYGKAILSSHQLKATDAMVIYSHSGINAVVLDIALAVKDLGMKLVAVTSLPHSSASPARHSSGKRLYEVADVVIDTGVPKADAALDVEGMRHPVGANSTSITIAIAHTINALTAESLVARGVEPMVMVNPNTADKATADKQNDANYAELWRRLKDR